MDAQALARLETKAAEAAIIARLQEDFNLAALPARLYCERMLDYVAEHLAQPDTAGQMLYQALAQDNPPGRAIAACRRRAVRLTLDSPDDLRAWRDGLVGLRRSKIQRLTEEAYAQEAVLTHEDLARLLCCSLATIKRDVAALRAAGQAIPTRGQVKDIGKGVSHKAQIVGDYLAGYTFSDIGWRRRHSLRVQPPLPGDPARQ
jgi:hypothetical protein